ncbi:hypothetical protein KCP73_10390 [Salmonella enterica subsp. enterica]|nr:hypothetical protein KCP73_10390 [Salmonella enterica subsp. enterica]
MASTPRLVLAIKTVFDGWHLDMNLRFVPHRSTTDFAFRGCIIGDTARRCGVPGRTSKDILARPARATSTGSQICWRFAFRTHCSPRRRSLSPAGKFGEPMKPGDKNGLPDSGTAQRFIDWRDDRRPAPIYLSASVIAST